MKYFSSILLLTFLIVFGQNAYSEQAFALACALGRADTIHSANKVVNPEKSDSTKNSPTGGQGLDTLRHKKKSVLIPIHQSPFYEGSYFISNETMIHNDYRYTGDYFKVFPFGFLRDRGQLGQPNSSYIYGYSNSSTSYLENGILLNNRSGNDFDLNNFESEFVDSIEIVPAPRGFLYGNFNNFSTVNFITKDFLTPKPLSRVRYYQGANGEIFIDGFYNGIIVPRLKLTLDIQNRNFDSTYTNSSYTDWLGNIRLKYYFSNKLNVLVGYNYVKSRVGLNGGVNVDSILTLTNNINQLLYDNVNAPVNFVGRTGEDLQHNFNLEFIALPFDSSKTDLNFYYQFHQNKTSDISSSVQEAKIKTNTIGLYLNQDFNFNPAQLKVLINYEHSRIENSSTISHYFLAVPKLTQNYFSIASILSFNTLDNKLVPSIFYKYGYEKLSGINTKNNRNGFGADVFYKILPEFNLYFGTSAFENSFYPNGTYSIEAGINYKIPNLLLAFQTFNYGNLVGIGSNFNFNFSKILVETNESFYFNSKDGLSSNLVNLPKFKFLGGIYYKDILFKENLDLKTGFVFNFYGTQEILPSQLINSSYYPITEINPSLQIDFTLVGEIQKRAIVYFTWENLLDNQYYLEPFYPMRSRNIRFGIGWTLFD